MPGGAPPPPRRAGGPRAGGGGGVGGGPKARIPSATALIRCRAGSRSAGPTIPRSPNRAASSSGAWSTNESARSCRGSLTVAAAARATSSSDIVDVGIVTIPAW